jgi:hypothetical protein
VCRFSGADRTWARAGNEGAKVLGYIDRALASIDRGRLLTRVTKFIRLVEFLGGSRKGIRNRGVWNLRRRDK